jgi:hypothetical protein
MFRTFVGTNEQVSVQFLVNMPRSFFKNKKGKRIINRLPFDGG